MSNVFLNRLAAALFAAGMAGAAAAAPVTVSDSGGGTASASPETQLLGFQGYNPANGGNSPDGYHNGNIFLAAGTYLMEYWGSGNSGFTNAFTLQPSANYSFTGGPIVSVGPGGLGGVSGGYSLTVTNVLGAFLDFIYSTDGGTPNNTADDCRVRSGAAVQPIGSCNYLAGVNGLLVSGASTNGSTGFLGFADRREAIDTDHQDLTVRISQIPEPLSLALVGVALAGAATGRRRRLPT